MESRAPSGEGCAKPGLTVRGKTGTLNNVIGFAGYVSGPSGRTCAAAVILNEVRDRSQSEAGGGFSARTGGVFRLMRAAFEIQYLLHC